MTQTHRAREHFNLYYLFLEDQATHPPPSDCAEHMRQFVLEAFAKRNASQDADPP